MDYWLSGRCTDPAATVVMQSQKLTPSIDDGIVISIGCLGAQLLRIDLMTSSTPDPHSEPAQATTTTNTSGGVDVTADQVSIGGDVVGRDKIENIAGDKVAGDKFVGIGKNVIQIGNLNVPLVPLIVILGISLVVSLFTGLSIINIQRQVQPTPMPDKMTGGFNVAVTEFEVMDANGNPVDSPDGKVLADWTHAQVKASLSEASIEKVVNNYEAPWPPERTGRVKGRTPDERSTAAAELAERINAHLVIYGIVTQAGDRSKLAPEFYVRKQGFEQGQELIGPHALGNPLRVVLPFTPTGFLDVDNPALAARIDALSLITIGLVYLSADKSQQALDYFRQAEQIQGWIRSAGKEIVYLLLGNANVRLSSIEKSTTPLAAAAQAYATALEINPDYARALLGQASVAYLQAITDPKKITRDTVDFAKLDEAERAYLAAGTSKDAPPSAKVFTKMTFGLGQIHFVRGALLSDTVQLAKARTEFETVIADYRNSALNDHDLTKDLIGRDLAGQAYAQLGAMAVFERDWPGAIESYQRAIPLVTPSFQAAYNAALGDAYLQAGNRAEAIKAYTEAVSIAENADPAKAEIYAEALKKIQTGP
jgi:tetratricopeptide (TPR) repeat protein